MKQIMLCRCQHFEIFDTVENKGDCIIKGHVDDDGGVIITECVKNPFKRFPYHILTEKKGDGEKTNG